MFWKASAKLVLASLKFNQLDVQYLILVFLGFQLHADLGDNGIMVPYTP